jgi:hypothetical protein
VCAEPTGGSHTGCHAFNCDVESVYLIRSASRVRSGLWAGRKETLTSVVFAVSKLGYLGGGGGPGSRSMPVVWFITFC